MTFNEDYEILKSKSKLLGKITNHCEIYLTTNRYLTMVDFDEQLFRTFDKKEKPEDFEKALNQVISVFPNKEKFIKSLIDQIILEKIPDLPFELTSQQKRKLNI